jgi:hypothetical protein
MHLSPRKSAAMSYYEKDFCPQILHEFPSRNFAIVAITQSTSWFAISAEPML